MDGLKFSWTQWIPFRPWRLAGLVAAADEVPDRLPPKAVVIVGTVDYAKWLAFDCPCGHSHRILIPLDKAKKPHWRVEGRARVSVFPSIDAMRNGVRCHYIIRDGRTKWV
jgi:hypothetical protein